MRLSFNSQVFRALDVDNKLMKVAKEMSLLEGQTTRAGHPPPLIVDLWDFKSLNLNANELKILRP